MPTVLRVHGFRVSIFFPPKEHPPPHVHVFTATGTVIIELAYEDRPQRVRRADGMTQVEVARAERVVSGNTGLLLQKWREIWER